ncbi:MAG: hypothetical protein V1909_05105 [Candidatus Micrarchaeota archaeon]
MQVKGVVESNTSIIRANVAGRSDPIPKFLQDRIEREIKGKVIPESIRTIVKGYETNGKGPAKSALIEVSPGTAMRMDEVVVIASTVNGNRQVELTITPWNNKTTPKSDVEKYYTPVVIPAGGGKISLVYIPAGVGDTSLNRAIPVGANSDEAIMKAVPMAEAQAGYRQKYDVDMPITDVLI